MTVPLLETRDLHAWYGKSHILQGVDLRVGEGEIVSLLGRNGVGRSTTCKAIMGEVVARGEALIRGRNMLGLKSHEIALAGVGYVPENRDIFPSLTTQQNLLLGVKHVPGPAWWESLRAKIAPYKRRWFGGTAPAEAIGDEWTIETAFDLFPNLRDRADVPAGALSGGEQQMLTICRTLMGNPALVMIDEPTEGLSPHMVSRVAELLRAIAARGVAILLVEQKLTIALEVSSRVYVMGHGRVVFEGAPDDLRVADEIQREWLEI